MSYPTGPVSASAPPVVSTPTIFRATAIRQLTIPAAAAQPALARAALVAGFNVQDQQLTNIRAQRGSKYSGAVLKPEKLPISVGITLADQSGGAQVTIVLSDRWPPVFNRGESVAAAFRHAFMTVLAEFDAALAAADPHAQFPEAECTIPSGAAFAGPSAVGRTIDRANPRLEATPGVKRRPTPSGSVTLVTPDAYAELDWTELQAMLTAGVLIATRPGRLPEGIARDVARIVAALETAAPQAGAAPGEVRIHLDSVARRVVSFLDLQAQLRGKLPLRTLHVCTTCRLEKIVNPDFQRLQQKNRKMRILTSTIGGAISTHGVSAFLLVGRLAHLKLLDPDFVCPRCQGMTAETMLVTFCPKCGERCDDTALRSCRKCSHDLRTEVTVAPLWTTGQPLPPPPAWPAPAPAGDPAAWAPPTAAFDPAAWPAPTVAGAGQPEPSPAPASDGPPAPNPGAWPAPSSAPVDLPPPHPAQSAVPAAWHPDPYQRHEYRWWDGGAWSDQVSTRGVVTADPVT